LPAGWPTPPVAKLIDPLSVAIPNYTYVSDGIAAWRVDYKLDAVGAGALTDVGTDYGAGVHARTYFSIPGDIWVGSERLFAFNPQTQIKLKRDPARVGLIGIVASNDFGTHEVWIDPSRDDVPIDSVYKRNDGPASTMTERWKFETFAQVHGGCWYPTRWKHTISYQQPRFSDSEVTLVHLQVEPKLPLDAKWFDNPIKRLANKPMSYSRP
jgi:hypothetical protein